MHTTVGKRASDRFPPPAGETQFRPFRRRMARPNFRHSFRLPVGAIAVHLLRFNNAVPWH